MGFPVAVKRCDRSPHLVTEHGASAVWLLVLDLHQWFAKSRSATVQFYNFSTYFAYLCRNQRPARHLLFWLYVTELITFLIMFQFPTGLSGDRCYSSQQGAKQNLIICTCLFTAFLQMPWLPLLLFFHMHLNRWTMVPHTPICRHTTTITFVLHVTIEGQLDRNGKTRLFSVLTRCCSL